MLGARNLGWGEAVNKLVSLLPLNLLQFRSQGCDPAWTKENYKHRPL